MDGDGDYEDGVSSSEDECEEILNRQEENASSHRS